MRITASYDYNADPDTVFEMMTQPEWLEQVAQSAGATWHDITVTNSGTHLAAKLPAPEIVKQFIDKQLEIQFDQTWESSTIDGTYCGKTTIKTVGLPASMVGTATLRASATGTILDYDGEFRVQLPLIGAKIESFAAPQLLKVLDLQHQVGRDWLAKHR